MSNTDSFLEEVAEEVRRDQLYAVLRKYGWIGIVLVLGIVAATAYFEYRKNADAAAAQAVGDSILAALEEDAPEARIAALSALTDEGGTAEVLLQFGKAGLLAENNQAAEAVAAYDAAAAAAEAGDPLGQLAALKAVLVGGETLAAEDRLARLEPLAQPGQPFWTHAEEQRGLIQLETGNAAAALAIFDQLIMESGLPNGMEQRLSQLIIALGGTLPEQTELLSPQ